MRIRNEIKQVALMMENRWSEFDKTKGDSYKKMDLRDLLAIATKNYNNGSHNISSDREMSVGVIDLIDAMNVITMVLIHRGVLEQLLIELDAIPHTGLGIGADIEDHHAPPEPRTLHGTDFSAPIQKITDEDAAPEDSPLRYAGVVTETLPEGDIVEFDNFVEKEKDVDEATMPMPRHTHLEDEIADEQAIEITAYEPPKTKLENPIGAKTLQETMDEGKIQAITDAKTPLENEKEDSDDNV